MQSGRRRNQVEEEDASTLKLGIEFNNAGCLMISEVKTLLTIREQGGKASPDTAVFKKTKAYVDTFAKFSQDSAGAAREALLHSNESLTQFELAQIANLCPENAEEAKNCIPSLLAKFDDDQLQAVLNEIHTLRKFQN